MSLWNGYDAADQETHYDELAAEVERADTCELVVVGSGELTFTDARDMRDVANALLELGLDVAAQGHETIQWEGYTIFQRIDTGMEIGDPAEKTIEYFRQA